MGIKNTIVDGKGSGKEACVTEDHSLLVTNTQVPPSDMESLIRPFRALLKNDAGSSDMRVNGATTSQDFFIQAPADGDRYVDTISIAIADAGAVLNKFGNINALTNGVTILYQDSELGDVVIGEDLTSNFRFLRMCGPGVHGIGSGVTSYRASNVEGASEGYLMSLDFSEVFGLPWGIRLKKDTTLRLIVRINDDVTGVDKFDMIAYGYDRIIK